MASNNEATTKFKADISELKSAMQEAKRHIALANSEFKAASSAMDNWSKSSDGITAKIKQLDNNLKSQNTILENYKKQLELVEKEYGKDSAEAEKLRTTINNQQATVNKTEKQLNNYKKELELVAKAEEIAEKEGRDVSEVYEELAKDVDEAADELEDAGDAAEKSSGGFTVMKSVIADLVAEGIRKAIDALKEFSKEALQIGMDFESGMSEVGAISGATGKDLEDLEETAKHFGETTIFSASESAEALKYMAMAGWEPKEMMEGLEGVINLAAASGEDLATTSDIVTDALTAFGMSADESGHFADILATASSNANTNVAMMGETFKYVAPVAGSLGITAEDTSVAIGLMANSGIKASQAGTALRAGLSNLVKPSKTVQEYMDRYNIALVKNEDGTVNLRASIADMRDKFSGLSEDEKAAAASAIFGKEAMSGWLAILNATDKDVSDLTDSIDNCNGAAQEMADKMSDNLSGDMKEFESAMEGAKIAAYEELAPSLRELVQYATKELVPMLKDNLVPLLRDTVIPAIKEFATFIVEHKDGIIAAISAIGAAFAVLKVASFIGKIQGLIALIGELGGIIPALGVVISALGGPITVIIAAVAGLAAGFTYLWNHSEKFRNFWKGLWDSIKDLCSKAIEGIKTIFNGIIDFVKNNWKSILLFITNPFAGAFKFLYDNCESFRKFINNFVEGVKKTISTWVSNLVNLAKDLGKKFMDNIVKPVSELPKRFLDFFTDIGKKVVNFGSDIAKKGADAAKGLFDRIVNTIKELPGRVVQIGQDIVKGLWNGITNMYNWVMNMIRGFVGNIITGFKRLLGIHSPSKVFANEIGKFIPEGIAVGIDKNAKSVINSAKNLTSASLSGASAGIKSASFNGNGTPTNNTVVNNFNQTINAPKQLSRLDVYRQSKNLLGYMGGV